MQTVQINQEFQTGDLPISNGKVTRLMEFRKS